MNTYEAMFLVNIFSSAKANDEALARIKDTVVKNGGNILAAQIWAEKRKLGFPIKKKSEATYYLVNFKLDPQLVDKLRQEYKLNEDVLRVLITSAG